MREAVLLGAPGASTTGASPPRRNALSLLMVGALCSSATSSDRVGDLSLDVDALYAQSTSAGGPLFASAVAPDASTAKALADLRRASGLTWEQLGRLFGVSRRAVHFWASGQPMSAAHEEHLRRALAVVEAHAAGANDARARLLTVVNGLTPLELLAARRFAEAAAALRPAVASPPQRRARTPLSPAAAAARKPAPPEELAAGELEPLPVRAGRGRAVRTARGRRRGDP